MMFIPFIPTDLNNYINAERTNRFKAAKIKKDETLLIASMCSTEKPIEYKADVYFTWHLKNWKKDPDNIAFAQKLIFDGLIKAEILKNDGHKQINSIHHYYIVDDKIGVAVEFRKADNKGE